MNQHRCETCKNCSKNPNDDYFCLVMNDEIDFTDFEHTAKVGCASHSDFQRTKCAEILDDLVTKIIEKRKDFQVPDKHGRCPEVPGFEWLLDYISNKIAEEGGFVLTNINHSDFQNEQEKLLDKIVGCLNGSWFKEKGGLKRLIRVELKTTPIVISNSVHCVKEGKCGFKSHMAAKNGFPCQFVGCVERLPSLPTSKEREAIIRNQTLDDVRDKVLDMINVLEKIKNTFDHLGFLCVDHDLPVLYLVEAKAAINCGIKELRQEGES